MLFFFFKFYFIFKLYNIVLVLPNIEMNPPQVYPCSPSWTLLPPPFPLPSLWVIPVHQPQASSIVHRTWTGDSFHTWYYTCFNAILPNLPTLSLSHRVHKISLFQNYHGQWNQVGSGLRKLIPRKWVIKLEHNLIVTKGPRTPSNL